ncbi:MAG: SDR family oxidoreductase [Legionellales bacterium]|jgi:thioester reductase-like protein
MTEPIYFITGTTGFLGSEILRTILKQDPQAQCYCLIRDLAQRKLTPESDRVFHVSGDITQENLGLSLEEYQNLARKITHVIHSAAMVQFEKPKHILEKINVHGTENMIAFAKAAQQQNPEFKIMGYVSTAYVAGRRTGVVNEQDLSDAYGFKNNYESTKYAAECLLHSLKTTLPVVIFRPSIILGHSEDGATPRTNVIFPLTQVVKRFPFNLGIMPVNKNCLLDLVPVDYVAKSIYFLLNKENSGQVFHLTSGQGKELSVGQVVDIFRQVYKLHALLVPARLWPLGRRLLSYTKKGQYFIKGMDPFWPYVVSNPQFCQKQTQQLLDQYQVRCHPMDDVLKKTLLFMEK